jgi:lipopolysaccharide export LptBFGC system permease protein LptF
MNEIRRPAQVPGVRLKRLAVRLFGAPVAQRYLYPAIADLQHEVMMAERANRLARFSVACRNYWAFWRASAACLLVGGPGRGPWIEWRVVARTAAATTLITAMFTWWPAARVLRDVMDRAGIGTALLLVVLLVPQGLAVAIPQAVLLVGFLGSVRQPDGGRRSGRAVFARSLFALSLVAAALSLVVLLWAVPAGNDAFRRLEYRVVSRTGSPSAVVKGANEMAMDELAAARLDVIRQTRAERARLDYAFHQRFAIPAASVVFCLAALAFGSGTASGRWRWPKAVGWSVATLLAYYWVMIVGRDAAIDVQPVLAPWLAAWTPNLVFAALALVLLSTRAARLATSPARQ